MTSADPLDAWLGQLGLRVWHAVTTDDVTFWFGLLVIAFLLGRGASRSRRRVAVARNAICVRGMETDVTRGRPQRVRTNEYGEIE